MPTAYSIPFLGARDVVMAGWWDRIGKIFGAPSAGTPRRVVAVSASGASSATASAWPSTQSLPERDVELFGWLLDFPPGPDRGADATEQAWLAALDPLIAGDKGRGELLPRAAGLIPQLLNSLRDEGLSNLELAQKVSRDANLVAEITRLANSVAYRSNQPVTELADAIRQVGTVGVRQAIAKVVLKPMFDAQAGGLSARAAQRLWLHAQAQADLCRAIALSRDMNPFEAYLGGLLGGIGWTAGLRALDRVIEQRPPVGTPAFSRGFQQGFRVRRDRLFVQFVTGWRLNPALHEAARDVQHSGSFETATHPLAQVLLAGERLATSRLASSGEAVDDLLSDWPETVRSAYHAVAVGR